MRSNVKINFKCSYTCFGGAGATS